MRLMCARLEPVLGIQYTDEQSSCLARAQEGACKITRLRVDGAKSHYERQSPSSPTALPGAGSADTGGQVAVALAAPFQPDKRSIPARAQHAFESPHALRKARHIAGRRICRPCPPSTFGPCWTSLGLDAAFVAVRYYVYQKC